MTTAPVPATTPHDDRTERQPTSSIPALDNRPTRPDVVIV